MSTSHSYVYPFILLSDVSNLLFSVPIVRQLLT
jgi:hypothetical protein